jgi:hypothetical protein
MSAETYSPNPSSGWLSKRYLGVPVVYLAGAVVAILVIVAYLGSKKNTTGATASTATTAPVDPYQTLNSTGTVTTSQPVYYVPANTQNVDTTAVQTNADWQKKAVEYLVANGSTVGDAQGAIQAYVTGQDMTYAQSNLVNTAVAKFGLPPTITNIGSVAAKPSDVVTAPENSSAPVNDVRIRNAYQYYLKRTPSNAEVLWWTSYMVTTGTSIDKVENLIGTSAEAKSKAG